MNTYGKLYELLKIAPFHKPCSYSYGLSNMLLVNAIAFAVLKILPNLVSIQKSLFANNCWSKVRKSAQHDLTFILIELSEKLNSFVKMRLVMEIKNVASFIKTSFYLKRGCTKMRENEETFYANKGCKMAIVFFISISLFSRKKFRAHFSNIICTKTWPCTLLHFIFHTFILHCIELIEGCRCFLSTY